MTNLETPLIPLYKFSFSEDRPKIDFEPKFLNQLRGALLQAQQETPSLPEALDKRVSQLAEQVYGLDELAYHLDLPDSEVEVGHLREAALKLLVKTIRFIEALPPSA